MSHIKKFEELDFSGIFKSKKEKQKEIEDIIQKRLDVERSNFQSERDSLEKEKKKLQQDQTSLIARKENEIKKEKEKEYKNKVEVFLNDWKQTCEEIKDGLYDLQDFCDDYSYAGITNNKYCCSFMINTGFDPEEFTPNNDLLQIFRYIGEIREHVKKIDKEILIKMKLTSSKLTINFIKNSDLFTSSSRRPPMRRV